MQACMHAGRQAGIQAGRHSGRQAGIQAGRQAGIQAGIQAGRHAGMQVGFQAGRQTFKILLCKIKYPPSQDGLYVCYSQLNKMSDFVLKQFIMNAAVFRIIFGLFIMI